MAEVELTEVTVKVHRGAVVVGAVEAALELREIRFDCVGADVAAAVFVS